MNALSPILCLGEALIDAVDRNGSVSEHVGGSLLNVANVIGAQGAPSALATWFGADERGARIADNLAAHKVAVVPGSDAAARTSVADAKVDADGHATYTFDLLWDVPDLDEVDFCHLHTGSLGAILEPGAAKVRQAMERQHERGTASFDPNARPSIMGEAAEARKAVEALVALSDIVKVSDEDLEWFYGEGLDLEATIDSWLALGPALVIVTLGGDGALAALRNGQRTRIAPMKVEVGDTVGAGDSFMGGLLAALYEAGLVGGLEAKERLAAASLEDVLPALERAATTSGITVSHVGAYAPTREECAAILG